MIIVVVIDYRRVVFTVPVISYVPVRGELEN